MKKSDKNCVRSKLQRYKTFDGIFQLKNLIFRSEIIRESKVFHSWYLSSDSKTARSGPIKLQECPTPRKKQEKQEYLLELSIFGFIGFIRFGGFSRRLFLRRYFVASKSLNHFMHSFIFVLTKFRFRFFSAFIFPSLIKDAPRPRFTISWLLEYLF